MQEDALNGTLVAGRHEIRHRIARGGMAVVYLADDVKRGRPTALKVMSPSLDVEDLVSFEQRFKREAQALSRLDHPHIVGLHDFGQLDDGRFFLAMDYIDGQNLDTVLGEDAIEVSRALDLALQLCSAVAYAHEQGVVHRDLKPSNLLIGADEKLQVVDFGLAQLSEPDQSITDVGEIVGSPHCMAPEQVNGVPSDHRVDIYAIGILLYRMLTGAYPFDGPNRVQTMISHVQDTVPPFSAVRPELVLPAQLEAVVRICLAKKPEHRYDSVAALQTELGECAAVHPAAWVSTTVTATFVTQVDAELEQAIQADQQAPAASKKPDRGPFWSWLFG